MQFIIQNLIFLIASFTTVGLITLNKSYFFYQQIIPLVLIIEIILNSRRGQISNIRKSISLFLGAILIQLIVVSTGGFYSPLLILLHIFTLATIIILTSSAPVSFLVFSLGVLIFHIAFDKNLNQFFQNDPWAVAIYALSIVIVIPLALYLSHSNRIKDQFNKILKDYIDMSEKKQKTILTALSNMVIVTDKNLKIVSINIAVERLLKISIHQVEGKLISEILNLIDNNGIVTPFENLPIQQALADKATHFAEGYSLQTKNETLPKPITIQIRPITDPSGEVIQIIFVLTDPLVKIGFNTHATIKQAVAKRDQYLSLITNPASFLNQTTSQMTVLLITHLEEDILTVQEMEDHPLQEVINFTDMVIFTNQILSSKKLFYQTIGSFPKLSFDDPDGSEASFLNLKNSASSQLNGSKYSAPIDNFLLKLILEKLFDIAVFLADSFDKSQININLSLDSESNIIIRIDFSSQSLTQKELPNLFVKDYPGIKIGQISKSSGLEGYIANRISTAIQLPIELEINSIKKIVTMTIVIKKQAKIHYQNSV